MFISLTNRRQKGFTLIELLVVVAVIGILASVILVGVAAFRGRARDSRRISDLRQIQNGLELCFTKNGMYPATLADIISPTGCNIGASQLPKDPSSGAMYYYCAIDSRGGSNPNEYTIGATLEEDNPVIKDQNGATFPCSPGGITCTVNNNGKNYCVTL